MLYFLFRLGVAGVAVYALMPMLRQISTIDPMSGAAAALGVAFGVFGYIRAPLS